MKTVTCNPAFRQTFTYANDINDSGQIVGYSFNTNSELRAFRTAPNANINPATDDLGTLGGNESRATSINNNGEVVGYSTTATGEKRAFRTAANSPKNAATDNLGTLGGNESGAKKINNLGQVLGQQPLLAYATG